MKATIGIDPGPQSSAGVLYDAKAGRVIDLCYALNDGLVHWICATSQRADAVAIERCSCYGRAVGHDTLETAEAAGRFWQAALVVGLPVRLVKAPDVRHALCGARNASDSQVHTRLVELHPGGKGTKREPGPLYGVAKHLWDALAVAVVAAEKRQSDG